MCGDDHPAPSPRRSERDIGAIEECAAGSCFRVRGLLIRRLCQAGLHLGHIEEIVVLALHHVAQSEHGQILHHGTVAILSIQAHHCLGKRNMLGGQIGLDRFPCTKQIAPVIAIASAGKRPEPLMCMGVKHGSASADDFATFVPNISWSADLLETSVGSRKVRGAW